MAVSYKSGNLRLGLNNWVQIIFPLSCYSIYLFFKYPLGQLSVVCHVKGYAQPKLDLLVHRWGVT